MELIERNINHLIQCCESHHVKSMWLFGSALDESQFNDESDIDFIVEFESFPILDYADNYFDLKDKLETTFNRSVDIVSANSLSNPYFIQEVDRTKRLIFSR
jgi:predicted nucleotidyltransferase